MEGDVKNAGNGAPSPGEGIANALMGKHAYSETGKDSSDNTVTGYGSTREQAHSDYQKKGGK